MNNMPLTTSLYCLLLIFGGGLFTQAAGAADDAEPAERSAAHPFADAIGQAQSRTVKIYGASIGRDPGYASGIIISHDGRILVAQGIYLAGEQIRVEMPDGSLHLAVVERRSEALQAAILKIDAETSDYFPLPEERVAEKGDWVLSVSNAFKVAAGDEPLSVNLGVISLRTELRAKRGTQDVPYDGEVLLIDAITSNPGAPGGALVTADGRLAGMIGKIIESKDTQTRLNYAVPSDLLAKFVAGKLPDESPAETTASSGKAVIGIRLFSLTGATGPAYVDRVVPGSPAHKAGLKPDDLIVSVNGERVGSIRGYKTVEQTLRPGEEIEFLVKRKNDLVRVVITPESE